MSLNENDDLDIVSIVQKAINLDENNDKLNNVQCVSNISDIERINDIKIQLESFLELYDLSFDPSGEFIIKNSSSSPKISKSLQRKLTNFYTFLQLYESSSYLSTQNGLFNDIELNKKILRFLCSIVKRACKDTIGLEHNPTPSLWSEIRERGCQFLGPQIQEDALKLILHALDVCGHMSRKVLVLYVVLRLRECNLRASKTSIGHVVQLLYRAGCFKLEKRDQQSSLMEIKREYSKYAALRRQHDMQIISIALEAGIRMTPEQWSKKLFGDETHRADMQSIIDSLQSQLSLEKIVNDLFNRLDSKPFDAIVQPFFEYKDDFIIYAQLDKTEARKAMKHKSKLSNKDMNNNGSSSSVSQNDSLEDSDDDNELLNESFLSDDGENSSNLTDTSDCPGINDLNLTNDDLNNYIRACSNILKCCFEYLRVFNEINESRKETSSVSSLSTSRTNYNQPKTFHKSYSTPMQNTVYQQNQQQINSYLGNNGSYHMRTQTPTNTLGYNVCSYLMLFLSFFYFKLK
jgi:hypothetical protein